MSVLLKANDYVGLSFFITSMALLASSIFFYQERERVRGKWKTSMTVITIVTFIAFIHYLYMRDLWVTMQVSPVSYRYIDWMITVPLQIVEFFLILNAVGRVPGAVFWRLLIASTVMLVAGYIGEAGLGNAMVYFTIGMLGWLTILHEIFYGEAASISGDLKSEPTKIAFNGLRLIVTVGWAIYPIGYVYGYMLPAPNIDAINIIYNFADFINKIAFGLIIWHAAVLESAAE